MTFIDEVRSLLQRLEQQDAAKGPVVVANETGGSTVSNDLETKYREHNDKSSDGFEEKDKCGCADCKAYRVAQQPK